MSLLLSFIYFPPKSVGFSLYIFTNKVFFVQLQHYIHRERALFHHIDMYDTNLITQPAVCHANHAITKFQHILTVHHEKSFSVTGFCRCSDPCSHGSLRARLTSYDPFIYWVHWLLNLLETSFSTADLYLITLSIRLCIQNQLFK